jgi:hypothetical protein
MRITRPPIQLTRTAAELPAFFVDGNGTLYLRHPTQPDLLAIYTSAAAYNGRTELPYYRSRKDVEAARPANIRAAVLNLTNLTANDYN